MRYGVLNGYGRVLARGAAVIVVGGLAASCSSSASRFSDGLFTGSTPNQRQILPKGDQPFPGDTASAAPADNYSTGSIRPLPSSGGVQRSALAPVPVDGAARNSTRPALAEDFSPPPRRSLDTTATGGTRPYQSAAATLPPPAGAVRTVDSRPVRKIEPTGKAPVQDKMPAKVAVLPDNPKRKSADKAQSAGVDTGSAKAKAHAGSYIVAEGDTLNRIAKAHGVTAAEIKAANGLKDGGIHIGQSLKMPGGAKANSAVASAKVDPIMTGTVGSAAKNAKAARPSAKSEKIEPTLAAYTPPKKAQIAIEAVEDDDSKAPGGTGIGKMRWPVRGRVVESYGQASGGKTSDGIDIAVPEGTPVKAAENGVVIYAGNGLKDFGNTVLVRHADGLVTVYGHADQLKVSRGDTVKRGQEIATSGMSGAADTPMLHFEVRKNSAAVDPGKFLE